MAVDFLAELHDVVEAAGVDLVGEFKGVGLFLLDEIVDAIEGDAAVVADEAAAGGVVREGGEDVSGAEFADLRGVEVENGVVVGWENGEDFVVDFGAGAEAVGFEGAADISDAFAVHDGTLEKAVGLEAGDESIVFGNKTWRKGVDVGVRGGFGFVDVLLALAFFFVLDSFPKAFSAGGGGF